MDVQPDQLLLEYDFSQRPPPPPRAKTSIAPVVGEVAAGDEVRDPPRDPSGRPTTIHPQYFFPEGAAGACYKDVETT